MPQPPALTDPVTKYARDVVAGRIVAGRLVRLACQRHLRDLETAPAKGLVWNPAEAERVIRFFPQVLRWPERVDAGDESEEEGDADDSALETALPAVLAPFQQFIAGSLFGWYKTNGRRRFRVAYIETGKGSGKTPFAAGLMIYRCAADGVRRAQVYFAATKLDQAKIPFADAEVMVKTSSSMKLRAAFDVTANNLAMRDTGSFIRAISAEKRGLDGKRVSAAHLEELHEHPNGVVAQKVRAGIKGRRNAVIVETTNAGFDRNSICWQHHELSREILEETKHDDSWFAFIAALDPCERCRAEGKLQPQESCAQCDDWRREGPHWLKANPNLGVSVPWQYLRDEVRVAMGSPSEQNMVKRLNFGIWTDQVTIWITADQWRACRAPAIKVVTPTAREEFIQSTEGRECFIGCDLSEKIDLSSIVCVFPRPMPQHLARVVDARDDDDAASARAIDVVSYFWMPEKTLLRRAKEDNVSYPDWRAQGYLTAWPGHLIDHDAMVDFLIEEIAKRRWRVRGIGVDQASATAFVMRLKRTFSEELVTEIPQGFRTLGAPSKTYEALVVSENLTHDGNPVMTMCITNMGKEENKWREIRPVKLFGQRKRIDGGVALIDGIYMMERTPSEDVSDPVLLTA